MKGDFSRIPRRGQRSYRGVLMQQGRVQLDSDWNEQHAIAAHASRQLIQDVLGGSGTPRSASGFEIVAIETLTLADGRHVRLPEWAGLDTGRPFTIEAWVSSRERACSGTIFSAGEPRSGSLSGPSVSLHIARDGHPEGRVVGGRGATSAVVRGLHAVGREVEHLALAFDGRIMHLYHAGRRIALEGFEPGDGRLLTESAIGAHVHESEDTAPSFDGRIHDVVLHDRALDVDELAARRHFGAGGGSSRRLNAPAPPRASGVSLIKSGRPTFWGPSDGEAAEAGWQSSLWVGPGRYYVDGVVVENDELIRLDSRSGHVRNMLPGSYFAILDVSSRTVNALQDPSLAEPALGGADTSVRIETTWRVDLIALGAGGHGHDPAEDESHVASRRAASLRVEKGVGVIQDNRLYRIEIHDGGAPVDTAGAPSVLVDAATVDEGVVVTFPEVAPPWMPGQSVGVRSTQSDAAGEVHARVVTVDHATRAMRLSRLVGLEGHEQLEVRPLATFKWSRDNGSVEYDVVKLDGLTVQLGRSTFEAHEPSPGDWVEFLDEDMIRRNVRQPLRQIAFVDIAAHTVTLAADELFPTVDLGDEHPRMIRWDGSGTTPATSAASSLEAGIQISFGADGLYEAGDAWTTAARIETQATDWPADGSGQPADLPPSPEHHRTPLAVVTRGEPGHWSVDEDLRRVFDPLPSHPPGELIVGGEGGDLRDEEQSRGPYAGEPGADRADEAERDAAAWDEVGAGDFIVGRSESRGWSPLADLPIGSRGTVRLVELKGMIYAITEHGAVFALTGGNDQWRSAGSLPAPGKGFAAAVLGERIHVVGGTTRDGHASDRHLAWSPDRPDATDERDRLPVPRHGHGLTAIDGKLHAVGGVASGRTPSRAQHVYDTTVDRWSPAQPLPRGRTDAAVAATDQHLVVAGGRRKKFLGIFGRRAAKTTFAYDANGKKAWARRKRMPTRRSDASSGSLAGWVFVVGGRKSHRRFTDASERYEHATNSWDSQPPLPHPRADHGAVVSRDGGLHVVGGTTPSGPVDSSAIDKVANVQQRPRAGAGDSASRQVRPGPAPHPTIGELGWGIDTAENCEVHAACLQEAGVGFACRYYNVNNVAKNLTRPEAVALSAAGIHVVAVWENGYPTKASYFTEAVGNSDGEHAWRYASGTIGQPTGTPVYFAVDYDASGSDIAGRITPYFRAVRAAFAAAAAASGPEAPRYQVGVYGSGAVCEALLDAGLVDFTWLAESTGWSGYDSFSASNRWNIKQSPSPHVCGLAVDHDVAGTGGIGGFQVAAGTTHSESTGSSPIDTVAKAHDPRRDGVGHAAHVAQPHESSTPTSETSGPGGFLVNGGSPPDGTDHGEHPSPTKVPQRAPAPAGPDHGEAPSPRKAPQGAPEPFETERWPVIPAKYFTRESTREVKWIVIHSTENPADVGVAKAVANYFAHPDPRQVSAHVVVDPEFIYQSVLDSDIAWAARSGNHGANPYGIHIEQTGYARFTRDEWLDADHGRKVIENAANVAAQYCLKFGIPVKHLTDTELAAGEKGIVSHQQVSNTWKVPEGHQDPGDGYPWDVFMERCQAWFELWRAGDAPAYAPDPSADQPHTASPSHSKEVDTYTVKEGDTLGEIAARFHTSVTELAAANGIDNPDLIHAGRQLVIPSH